MKYKWEKRIKEMPRENGKLSSEALRELLRVTVTARDPKESAYALKLYKIETKS